MDILDRQVVMEVSYMEFHDNRSSGSRADTRGQTDRLDETNRHFSREPERASKWTVMKSSHCMYYARDYLHEYDGRYFKAQVFV